MSMWLFASTFVLFSGLFGVQGQSWEPKCDDKQVIVHLFEWPWHSVAKECEDFLGPMGFCGVQVSPPMEHILGHQWWTRYQPVSYKLVSRSGDRDGFIDMVNQCNAVGVMVIVDMVINHMTGENAYGLGTDGSLFYGQSQDYPAVPYTSEDFHHPKCVIEDYQNVEEVRNCYLVNLNDLNGGDSHVRGKIIDYFNDLVDIGVKGFRIDASKHMWPSDLAAIQSGIQGDPFIFHEVIYNGGEPITPDEYFDLGKVTEFRACSRLASYIRNHDYNNLANFGEGLMTGLRAVVFVDNHDNQRNHGGGGDVLTYKDDINYKLAVSFLLAQSFGFKRVMSSYYFNDTDAGPPSNAPLCNNDGWVCEHRWSTTANMVRFANKAAGHSIENWQVKDDSLGFSRGNVAFFAMGELNNVEFYTGLPDGEYCDIIHECKQMISVSDGMATFGKAQDNDPVAAICVGCQSNH